MSSFEEREEDDKHASEDIINFHEKVDTLLAKEEDLISCHMSLIKENA